MLKRYSIAFVALLLMLAAATLQTGAADPAPDRYIIFTEDQAASDCIAKEVGKKGGAVLKPLALQHQNGLVVQINKSTLEDIAGSQGVKAIEPDVKMSAVWNPLADHGSSGQNQPDEILPWGIAWIKAGDVWDTDGDLAVDPCAGAGAGIKVAIVDSGIDRNHPDLADNLAGGINLLLGSSENTNSNWNDYYGHGTHVAGIVAAADNNIGVIGAAPRARLYSVRVLDNKGRGYSSDLIDAMYWCVDNGINIANLSVGIPREIMDQKPNTRDALEAAFNYAYGNGVLLVAAAGNLNPYAPLPPVTDDNVDYPARFDNVMAVSAIDQTGARFPYSKTGPAVEIAAPGVQIASTFLKDSYFSLIGTSMAAPHVTGAAALVMATGHVTDLNGNGIADEVRAILRNSAASGNPLLGRGTVNADQAVKDAN